MRAFSVRSRLSLVITLGCAFALVLLFVRSRSGRGRTTIHGLIRALEADAPICLPERGCRDIEREIRLCEDVALLEACILAIENGRADCPDADSRNRIAGIWDGHCVQRLVDIGTEEAASVLVRMLARTDAGGSMTVSIAITEIGPPALAALQQSEALRSKPRLREDLCEAIEQGQVWTHWGRNDGLFSASARFRECLAQEGRTSLFVRLLCEVVISP